MFPMRFSGQRSLIWQNKSLMWHKHLAHMFKQVIMCGNWVEIPLTQLAMLRVPILYVHIIHIVPLVVVDLFTIVHHELWTTRFRILTRDPTNYHCLLWARRLYYVFALCEKFNLILKVMRDQYFREFHDGHVQRVQHSPLHVTVLFYYLHIK